MIIAFLGADGSGKSTIINNFVKTVRSDWNKLSYVHFRPNYFIKNSQNQSPVTDPHSGKSRGMLMSIIKLLYFVLEYNYAYMFHYKDPNHLIIFDRYYYDVIADPKRVKSSAPIWFSKFLMKFIPRPDLVFYLHAPADVIHARKKEINKDTLEKILSNYLSLTKTLEFNKISTEDSIDETLANIIQLYKNAKNR